MSNKNAYQLIGDHLDKRLLEDHRVIEGIKSQLFDVLTLGEGDQKTREEICDNIQEELKTKKEQLERDNPMPRNNQIQKRIDNLQRLWDDTEKRKKENKKTEVEPVHYINLDKKDKNGEEFDKKVIDNVADSIIEQSKISDKISDALVKRMLGNGKYKKELSQTLNDRILVNWRDLDKTQRQNLWSILGDFDEGVEKLNTSMEKEDLQLINKAIQDGTDSQLRSLESKLQSRIAIEKYKELYDNMMSGNRISYVELVQQLGDFLENHLRYGKGGKAGKSVTGKKQKEKNETNDDEKVLFEDYTGKKGCIFISCCKEHGIKRKDGTEIDSYERDVIDGNEFIDSKGNVVKLQLLPSWETNDDYGVEPKFRLLYVGKNIEKPKTEKPKTEKPKTEKPTTEKPKTEKPKTEKPTTEKPKTEKPTTEKPKTEKPTTEKPKTEKPTTEKPTTEKPTTEKPTTEKPKTEKPTTEKPKTEKPKTEKPKTEKPTTEKPKTEKPTTEKPKTDDGEEPVVFKEDVVISDVSESYEDMISREVENEINEERHNTGRFNVFKRLDFFLRRGRIRKKKIQEKKENYERTPFTNNGLINREMAKQAARHDLESLLGGKGVNRDAFGKINRKTMIAENEVSDDSAIGTARGKEFREMCQNYVAGRISKIEFQEQFNTFVKDKLGLPKEQQFVATNILEKLDAIRGDNVLLRSITNDLKQYLQDRNISHFDEIRRKINDDFKKYKRDPRFRADILKIIKDPKSYNEADLDKKINQFIKHQEALAKASTTNLQIKLDLLTNGKGAYQTNNKDRENWLFKIGHAFDKMPWWGQALTVAGISASGIAVGLLGGSALAATATVSGLVGAKNFIKKWTHHTKEQNTYEKNLARNYEEEIAQMKEWERISTEKDSEGKYTSGRFARYRAKRQLELYGKTTQSELQNENTGNTRDIAKFIYGALDRYDSLEPAERNALNCTILDAQARLQTYWAMGHNFLKSNDKNQIERDFYHLENALNLSANRILGAGATLKDIPQIRAVDMSGKEVDYNDLLNLYKKDYNSASKKFRGERAWLATKWGLGTAAITFGTAVATQAITGTGMFAKDAVAGTPGTPDSVSTSNTATVTDNFGMGKYELAGGNQIFNTAQSNVSGLSPSDTVTLHFGAGTDGTAVRAGSALLDHSTYVAKLDQVKDVIANSSLSNKSELISQLDSGFATSGFTNTDLHGMRCLEAIEETVKGAGNFAGRLNLSYDAAMDIDGTIVHDATSRVGKAFLEISKFIPGQPGTEAVEAGNKWLVIGLPWFSNTFKRKNEAKAPTRPIEDIDNGWDDEGNIEDSGYEGGGEGTDDSPEGNGPKVGPKPADPKKDPDGVHKDDEPKPEDVGKKIGEVKGIVTRGHKINAIDDSDLGTEYPGEGKILTPIQAATNLIVNHWEGNTSTERENKFSQDDIVVLSSMSNTKDQIGYLAGKIEEDRARIEKTEEQEAFDHMLQEIEDRLPKHLKDIFGEDYKYLNTPMSKDRIHLVSDRDFLAVDCNSKDGVLGVFRSKNGDIYISHSFLEKSGGLNGNILYSMPDPDGISTIKYPELFFNIIHTVVHEMIHSMSVINYFDTKKGGKKSDYFPRRTGLKRVKLDKTGIVSAVDGTGFNEGATESLAWAIVSRWHKPYKDSKLRAYMCYKDYINIIEEIEEMDGVKKIDFWKGMLIRKRGEGPDNVERNTPLYELIKKMNGTNRPRYYDLIMYAMDKEVDTDNILNFIRTKNIKYLKDGLPSGKSLSKVFSDKTLLTEDGKDFKKEILDAYSGK